MVYNDLFNPLVICMADLHKIDPGRNTGQVQFCRSAFVILPGKDHLSKGIYHFDRHIGNRHINKQRSRNRIRINIDLIEQMLCKSQAYIYREQLGRVVAAAIVIGVGISDGV